MGVVVQTSQVQAACGPRDKEGGPYRGQSWPRPPCLGHGLGVPLLNTRSCWGHWRDLPHGPRPHARISPPCRPGSWSQERDNRCFPIKGERKGDSVRQGSQPQGVGHHPHTSGHPRCPLRQSKDTPILTVGALHSLRAQPTPPPTSTRLAWSSCHRAGTPRGVWAWLPPPLLAAGVCLFSLEEAHRVLIRPARLYTGQRGGGGAGSRRQHLVRGARPWRGTCAHRPETEGLGRSSHCSQESSAPVSLWA